MNQLPEGWTNKFQLPPEIAARIAWPRWPQDPGRMSVTALTQSPRARQLMIRHEAEIVQDVASNLWSFMGQCAHAALEQLNIKHGIHEEKFCDPALDTYTVSGHGATYKVLLVGRPDLYLDRGDGSPVLADLKLTGTWAFILGHGDKAREYEPQLNIYKLGYFKRCFPVSLLEIWAFLRDWNINDYYQNLDKYPPCQFLVVPIKTWEKDRVEEYIRERILLHKEAELLSDTSLPECTSEERWEQPAQWRVTKAGCKRATRCFGLDQYGALAEGMARDRAGDLTAKAKKGERYEVTYRAGEWGKCMDRIISVNGPDGTVSVNHRYCAVAPWCNTWQKHLAEVQAEKEEEKEKEGEENGLS